MDSDIVDLVIVGAGPAGMAAACEARTWGLDVTLLDEQTAVGGQIYRAVDTATEHRRSVLGEDYAAGAKLTDAFAKSGARHIDGATVWNVGRDLQVNYIQRGANIVVHGRHIILASGAMERPFPIPGWTLPGVMGVGAAQILYKSSGMLPSEPVVLAGCGPLLYLVASQYLQAGVKLRALIHTTQGSDYLRASSHLVGALRGWRDLRKGMRLFSHIRHHRVPIYAGAETLSIQGGDHAEAICFNHKGRSQRIESSLILLHQGVVPNTQLSWLLKAKHRWNDALLCWEPETDDYGQIEDTGIYIAGDSRSIVGAKASASQGRLAAIAIAAKLDHLTVEGRHGREKSLRSVLRSQVHIRSFLEALYRPPVAHRIPQQDSVIVCRCEEVSAADIRKYVELGCQGPNQTKAFGRCGMGHCQGRLCGLTVTEIIAQARGLPPEEIGYYRIRPPIKPVTLAELAG